MYEPYSNLSLPVPGSNSIQLNILVFSIPLEQRNLLQENDDDVKTQRAIMVAVYIDQNDRVSMLVEKLKQMKLYLMNLKHEGKDVS